MDYEDWREVMEAKGHTGFTLTRQWYEATGAYPYTPPAPEREYPVLGTIGGLEYTESEYEDEDEARG